MLSKFTIELMKLEGTGELNRKQLRDWTGRSLSYVDQRFRGDEAWGEQEKDRIVRKAFELEIAPIMNLYLPDDRVLMDLDYMADMLDGDIQQELKEVQKCMGHLIDNWDAEKFGPECREECAKAIKLFATIQKESEKRS